MSLLWERGCPIRANCHSSWSEVVPAPRRLSAGPRAINAAPARAAASAPGSGGGAPGAAGAGHPAQPLPPSPPFISPRLAPARSPGPSTAPFAAPPPSSQPGEPAVGPRGFQHCGPRAALHGLQGGSAQGIGARVRSCSATGLVQARSPAEPGDAQGGGSAGRGLRAPGGSRGSRLPDDLEQRVERFLV